MRCDLKWLSTLVRDASAERNWLATRHEVVCRRSKMALKVNQLFALSKLKSRDSIKTSRSRDVSKMSTWRTMTNDTWCETATARRSASVHWDFLNQTLELKKRYCRDHEKLMQILAPRIRKLSFNEEHNLRLANSFFSCQVQTSAESKSSLFNTEVTKLSEGSIITLYLLASPQTALTQTQWEKSQADAAAFASICRQGWHYTWVTRSLRLRKKR